MALSLDKFAKRVEEFNENGYLVIPNALSQEQVVQVNRSIDSFMQEYPETLVELKEGYISAVNVLPNTDVFDGLIEHPCTLNILRSIIGDKIAFEEFGFIIRDPCKDISEYKSWHRDLIRDYDRRMEISYISCVFYLTDVTEEDHCFAIIPRSHNAFVDLRPEDIGRDDGVEVIAPAGSAVIFHGRCIHTARLKPSAKQRRSVHIYYDQVGMPRCTEFDEIPERLHKKCDPMLPPYLYAKWDEIRIVDGVGKIPEGVDRSLPAAEIVRIIQATARRATGQEG